jgi:hypothetical protein
MFATIFDVLERKEDKTLSGARNGREQVSEDKAKVRLGSS